MPDSADATSQSSGWDEVRDDLRASVKALLATFRSRDLGLVQVAFFVFELTEWGGLIALFVYAYQRGGTGAVGLVALLQQIPAAVVASFGSVLGDRFDRRRVLGFVMLALATVTVGAGVAMVLDAPAPVAVILACSSGWVLTLVRPTYGALLPWLVRSPQELTTSYAAGGLIESVCMFFGPLLVGAVLAFAGRRSVSGPGLAYLVLGAALLLGTAAVWMTRATNRMVEDEPAEAFRPSELWAGYEYVFRDDRRRLLVTLVGSNSLLLGMIDTLIVVLAIDVLGRGDAGVGFLNAALGVGAVIGALVSMVAGQRARLFPSFRNGLLSAGAPLAVAAAAPVLAAPMLAVSGGGMQVIDVTGRTMLQRIVPDEKLSRAYGVLESLYMAMEGIGAFVASLAIVWIGPRWSLLVASLVLPAAGLLLKKRLASFDVGVRVPTQEMALLRATDLFGPMPPAALERLARNLVPLDVAAEGVVIREGDPGSRFFLIERGRVLITRAGEAVVDRGRGDYFGEVALLYDQPRNATVTATSDVRLLVLERDEFLRVVTGHEAVGSHARRVAEERSAPDPS